MEPNNADGTGGVKSPEKITLEEVMKTGLSAIASEEPAEKKEVSEQQAETEKPPAQEKAPEQESEPPASEKKPDDKRETPPGQKEKTPEEMQREVEGLKKALFAERTKRQYIQGEIKGLREIVSKGVESTPASELPPAYQDLYKEYQELDPGTAELKKKEWLIQIRENQAREIENKNSERAQKIQAKSDELRKKIYNDFPDMKNAESDLYKQADGLRIERGVQDSDFIGQTECVLDASRILDAVREKQSISNKFTEIKQVMDTVPPPASPSPPSQPKKTYNQLMQEARQALDSL